jgi:hypothetical protein
MRRPVEEIDPVFMLQIAESLLRKGLTTHNSLLAYTC